MRVVNCPDSLPDDSATNQLAVSLVLDWSTHEGVTYPTTNFKKHGNTTLYLYTNSNPNPIAYSQCRPTSSVVYQKIYTETSDYIGLI